MEINLLRNKIGVQHEPICNSEDRKKNQVNDKMISRRPDIPSPHVISPPPTVDDLRYEPPTAQSEPLSRASPESNCVPTFNKFEAMDVNYNVKVSNPFSPLLQVGETSPLSIASTKDLHSLQLPLNSSSPCYSPPSPTSSRQQPTSTGKLEKVA